MQVVKRDGSSEPVSFVKIERRLSQLAHGLAVDPTIVAQKIIASVKDGIATTELDELAAQTSAAMSATHPDYGVFAARVAVSNLHKNVPQEFATVCARLHAHDRAGERAPLVSDELLDLSLKFENEIETALRHDRDYENYDYFGFKTLERSYLLRIDDRPAERPQHLLMRVALGVHGDDIEAALESYDIMSRGLFTHASPTLFNAGTPRASLASCFLLDTQDSIEDIFKTVAESAVVSKAAGGIGLNMHDVRAAGSYIRGTGGKSNGLIPFVKVLNEVGRAVDQGGGKRKGAIAVFLAPWHADVFDFLELRKNRGAEELRARDIFLGLWIPDIFMRRVEADADWTLMDPNTCMGLPYAHGEVFDSLYEKYEREGLGMRKIKARELWTSILDAQIETGNPYMLFADAVNKHSNQKNLGTIKSSNLCCEVVEYTSSTETAVCTLGSIALGRFVKTRGDDDTDPKRLVGSLGARDRYFDFEELAEVARVLTRNLNKVVDRTFYPSTKSEYSNMKNRPIGIGAQGLADAFVLMGLSFDSPGAAKLNRRIFETIYFAALDASCDLAVADGPYDSYEGSPISHGVLHFDSFGGEPDPVLALPWSDLRRRIAEHGVRNSLLVAPMPTASTAQILGSNECFEPFTSNVYVRRVLSGEFVLCNKHLVADLVSLGLWTPALRNDLVLADGSVQTLDIPDALKAIYKTAWEISGRTLVDLAADRQAFVDQSQSLNVFMANPTHSKLSSYHFYAWKKGLKTGSYYIRIKAAASAIKFTATKKESEKPPGDDAGAEAAKLACSLENPESCIACSG